VTSDDIECREYEQLLEEFTQLCEGLVEKGLPYLAVILCHELYRFLYPLEPYVNFKNTDPVGFIIDHIKRLITLGQSFSKNVAPYDMNLSLLSCCEEGQTLEESTSELYSDLWQGFDTDDLTDESFHLLTNRLPKDIIEENIVGKNVLDMGCGSGRYSIALAKAGAGHVIGVDLQSKSFAAAKQWCEDNNLSVQFEEGNVCRLSFDDNIFDFVFCNGVLHHTSSIEKGLQELSRVLKRLGKAFLYLYASGGVFWTTRRALRRVFKKIPIFYTKSILQIIGMPSKRFVFCDTWYVPQEIHTTKKQLVEMLEKAGFSYQKITGNNTFDLDAAIERNVAGAKKMWGDGEHRYILELQ
jgi:ubiquinone/menaquinone biosynthesis C-methylase UbiE